MSSTDGRYRLGTIEASEAVLEDLYVSLRRAIAKWAAVTNQTPQARMGYIGQHLTSVVTGYPGGRSGARGKDLILPNGKAAEIKTCYRVDQLGACKVCGHAVASIELACPNCGATSTEIDRKDDSKWLIAPKSEQELEALFESEWFYLVLFDFADFADPREINARIWQVDPRSRGFAYCMVDYYFNIRAKSQSKAPFNLWPFSFKFGLLGGELIYWAIVHEDDTIETVLFPAQRGQPESIKLDPMTTYTRSTGLTNDALRATVTDLGLSGGPDKTGMLEAIEAARDAGNVDDQTLSETLADHVYLPRIEAWLDRLPDELRP
jgi:hypothetical protein